MYEKFRATYTPMAIRLAFKSFTARYYVSYSLRNLRLPIPQAFITNIDQEAAARER